MRRISSLIIIASFLLELFPGNVINAQGRLKIGLIGVFSDEKELVSFSNLVIPIFSTSKFFAWEKVSPDIPFSNFWGIARVNAKFIHNKANVTGSFKVSIVDPLSNVEMFVLESSGISSVSSEPITTWEPLEKEAFLNGISNLSQRLDDLWKSNKVITYYEDNAFECDIGRSSGILEGSILSVFRNDRLVAKGKVTSLDNKVSKAEVVYKGDGYPPQLGDTVRVAYVPPSPEVSFVNQVIPILNAMVGIAILAGLVVLYNSAKAATPWIDLISPDNSSSFHSGDQIKFTWITNDTTIQQYDLVIDGNHNFPITDKYYNYTAPVVLTSTSYSWKVVGYRGDGTKVESETRTFTVNP
ncbi:MAG: hypothetical protein ACP5RW_04535 [bacterium]